ncbi:MAG: HNH endonuclease [Clostridium sp.]|uniref:HNH endonuclease n=1 Tax=Clostridium sp. TaxID=1506 RepID=UPI0025C1556B|nr:HNH endonuclease signature motif containing protein [Clostridium sp.]MBS4956590.1 HNH endonuclease [Clostridium sp.]
MCDRKYSKKELTLMNNIKKSNERCYYCRCVVKESKRTVDHKIPVSRGGLTKQDNLVMSCKECNIEKGFLTEEEYREYREIADIKVNENIKVSALNSLLASYKEDSELAIKEKKRLRKINKEIDKLILTIRDSKLLENDCYNFCKVLQDNLKERDIANNKLMKLENNLRNSKKHKKEVKKILLLTENKIRKNYRKQYINIKCVQLTKNL